MISSYNIDGAAQLQGHNYKNCIRREEGYCCIQYTVIDYGVSNTACINNAATRCSGASVCTVDYIIIPNTNPSGVVNYDRYFLHTAYSFIHNVGISGSVV